MFLCYLFRYFVILVKVLQLCLPDWSLHLCMGHLRLGKKITSVSKLHMRPFWKPAWLHWRRGKERTRERQQILIRSRGFWRSDQLLLCCFAALLLFLSLVEASAQFSFPYIGCRSYLLLDNWVVIYVYTPRQLEINHNSSAAWDWGKSFALFVAFYSFYLKFYLILDNKLWWMFVEMQRKFNIVLFYLGDC